MDAAQALADLTEISSQIEGAVIADPGGVVLASTFSDDGRAGRVAGLARDLLGSAEEVRGDLGREELVQLEAATPEGSVFVVRDGERVVVAVTRPQPTVGLVFYDLKTCLRLLGQSEAPAPAKADEDA
jgi:predicted regulator of Ras-like GTPase activity (Roadblock/LC7/MglB family)